MWYYVTIIVFNDSNKTWLNSLKQNEECIFLLKLFTISCTFSLGISFTWPSKSSFWLVSLTSSSDITVRLLSRLAISNWAWRIMKERDSVNDNLKCSIFYIITFKRCCHTTKMNSRPTPAAGLSRPLWVSTETGGSQLHWTHRPAEPPHTGLSHWCSLCWKNGPENPPAKKTVNKMIQYQHTLMFTICIYIY